MRIPQEAFSKEEGVRLQKKLLRILTERYGVSRVEETARVLAWADKDIAISVPRSGTCVEVWIDRKPAFGYTGFNRVYDEPRIKIGRRRWQKLEWMDGEWHFDAKKLFKKIGEEILKLKGEYMAQQAEASEMEENRAKIAAELGIDPAWIKMQTPFAAAVHTPWGHALVGYDPVKAAKFCLRQIYISRQKDFRLPGTGLIGLLKSITSALEGKV